MKTATAWAIGVVAISVAIGAACWATKSGWPLLAFALLPNYSSK